MIDASLSAHKEISFEQEAAAHFIRQVLRPGDRLAVFSFDEDVTQAAPFSDNVATLQAAVRKIPPGAGTSIYDAVLLGAGGRAQTTALARPVQVSNAKRHWLTTNGGTVMSKLPPPLLGPLPIGDPGKKAE